MTRAIHALKIEIQLNVNIGKNITLASIETINIELMDTNKQLQTSAKYRINIKDTLRGLVMAVLTPSLVELQHLIDSGLLLTDWKKIGMIALGAFVGYLIKNFFTGPSIKIPIKNEEVDPTKPETAK